MGIERARGTHHSFDMAEFAGYLVVGLVLLAASAVAARAASRHTAASREDWLIHCELEGVDVYLAPMPPSARALMRGTLVPRIFPSPRESDEPWREPRWPDAETLMTAIGADDTTDP